MSLTPRFYPNWGLSDEACAAVGAFLRLDRRIKVATLSGNRVTDDGARACYAALGLMVCCAGRGLDPRVCSAELPVLSSAQGVRKQLLCMGLSLTMLQRNKHHRR